MKTMFLDILANHKNTKTTQTGDKAGGTAQTTYRYQDLSDLPKFNEHAYPYYLDVVMTDTVDKKITQFRLFCSLTLPMFKKWSWSHAKNKRLPLNQRQRLRFNMFNICPNS